MLRHEGRGDLASHLLPCIWNERKAGRAHPMGQPPLCNQERVHFDADLANKKAFAEV
jgi:hypothetical protein